jgi:hypothetical protein
VVRMTIAALAARSVKRVCRGILRISMKIGSGWRHVRITLG